MATHSSTLSCLENSMDRETQWTTVHGGHKESDMSEHTHTHTHTHPIISNYYLLYSYVCTAILKSLKSGESLYFYLYHLYHCNS